MILILSDAADETTCSVMEWINVLNPSTEVVRINNTDKIISLTISNNSIVITFQRWNSELVEIDFSKITAYWYRRGKLNFSEDFLKPFFQKQLHEYNQNELKRIAGYLHYRLRKIKSLNSFFKRCA